MIMPNSTPESRLDRIESAIDRLIQVQAATLVTQQQHEERLGRIETAIEELLASERRQDELLRALQAGAERQDRILDYLMRRDGERT